MRILSKEEMYFYDKNTIKEIGIPGRELMENAGKGCAEFIRHEIIEISGLNRNPDHSTIIFCGSGNNGGDGFVIARYLKDWGYNVRIIITGSIDKMSPETHENYDKCTSRKIQVNAVHDLEQWENTGIDLDRFDIIIDAIFGIGFQGDVKGWFKDLFGILNRADSIKIAIDIASGTEANTGQAANGLEVDYTLTMAAYKFGHFLGEGRKKAGEVLVIDIGIPELLFDKFPASGTLVTSENAVFPVRSKYSHKGDYGKVGIIAGSPGFSGAAVMAAKSALRSGAGIIKLFHPKGMEQIFECSLTEVMTHPIPQNSNNEFDCIYFLTIMEDLDALLVGPGIGTSKNMRILLKVLLEKWDRSLILDADAINIISSEENMKTLLKGRLLTPHVGEFSRLTGKSIEEITLDPIGILKAFTGEYECCVLLKSATTIFTDGKEFIVDISGNDGLSTGGSGDVLAGIIISFLGQKLNMKNAAVSASYLLGTTAEKLAEIRLPASIIPSDIIEELFKY